MNFNNPYQYNNFNYTKPIQSNFNQGANNFLPLTFVNGLEGAKNFIVQPNQVIYLVDNNDPYIYIKSSNALGQADIRCFEIKEVNANGVKSDNDYITRKELEEILKGVKANESNVTNE